MTKLKKEFYIPNKNLLGNGIYKEITITIKGPNSDGNILFEADLPTYVFEKLKNTSDLYKTKDNGGTFRKKVSSPIYKYLCKSIQEYCRDAEVIQAMEKLEKQKKIFISFDFVNKLTKDNWCGAGTGKVLSTRFQHFVGYKTSTMRVKLGSSLGEKGENKKSECIIYSSYYVSLVDLKNHREGTLQPLNMDWQHEKVENSYKIIDWTQEREDFLKEIENKFNNLGTKLNDFLGDLDSDKLDTLIENKLKLLD